MSKPSKMDELLGGLMAAAPARATTSLSSPVHPTAPQRQTRAQQDLKQAVQGVGQLESASGGVKKNYIRRVKQFPALVMTVGLAQALAFSAEKAGKDNDLGEAHKKVLEHVAAVLEVSDALRAVQAASTADYLHMTRRVLAAWTYYRRFAVSLLDPEGKLQAEDQGK
jgi:CRISPR-associated protein Cmr5